MTPSRAGRRMGTKVLAWHSADPGPNLSNATGLWHSKERALPGVAPKSKPNRSKQKDYLALASIIKR